MVRAGSSLFRNASRICLLTSPLCVLVEDDKPVSLKSLYEDKHLVIFSYPKVRHAIGKRVSPRAHHPGSGRDS